MEYFTCVEQARDRIWTLENALFSTPGAKTGLFQMVQHFALARLFPGFSDGLASRKENRPGDNRVSDLALLRIFK